MSLFRKLLNGRLGCTALSRMGFCFTDVVVLISQRTWIHAHLHELHGKDLVCWCPAELACHADVLLEEANR